LLLAGCALVSQLFPPKPPEELPPYRPENFSDAAVRLPGAESTVAGIALQDFIRFQYAEIDKYWGLAPDGGIREPDDGGTDAGGRAWTAAHVATARCSLDLSTYEAWVELDSAGNRWKVVLLPTAKCAEGAYDGDAEYEIDVRSFEIVKRVVEH
jgi:hypothetical protein